MNKRCINILQNQTTQTQHGGTIVIIIGQSLLSSSSSSSSSVIVTIITLKRSFKHYISFGHHVIVPQWPLILRKFRMHWNRHETESLIIIRKCDIAKCDPGNITKSKKKKKKKYKREKQILSTLILTKHLIHERLCSTNSIFYVSLNKALFFCHKFFYSS